MRVATWVRTKHIKYNAPWNDSINNIIYSVISSLTEFKTVLVLIFNPHLSAKLTPSPGLRRIPRKRVPPSGGRTNNVHLFPFVCASNFVSFLYR